jgi:hypothetical protein
MFLMQIETQKGKTQCQWMFTQRVQCMRDTGGIKQRHMLHDGARNSGHFRHKVGTTGADTYGTTGGTGPSRAVGAVTVTARGPMVAMMTVVVPVMGVIVIEMTMQFVSLCLIMDMDVRDVVMHQRLMQVSSMSTVCHCEILFSLSD